MRRGRRTLVWIEGLLGSAWAALHLGYCWAIVQSDRLAGDLRLLIAALGLNLLILFLVVVTGTTNDPRNERRLGLLGGFILGITPLGLTAIAVSTTVADLRETFRPTSPPVDLSCYNRLEPSAIKFYIGVDVSQSFLRKENSTKEQVCEVLRRMLRVEDLNGWGSSLVTPEADAEIWQFGSRAIEIEEYRQSGTYGASWVNEVADNVCSHLQAILDSRTPQSLNTDILGFLREVQERASPALKRGDRVAIILLSDFLQHTGEERGYDVEQKLRTLMLGFLSAHQAGDSKLGETTMSQDGHCTQDAVLMKRFAILGLTVPPPDRPLDLSEFRPVDIAPLLRQRLPDHFQSISLPDVLKQYSPHDLMQLIGSTSAEIRIEVGSSLYIKYRSNQEDQEHLKAEVLEVFPQRSKADGRPLDLALKLRAHPDRDSLPAATQLRYQLDGGPRSLLTSSAADRGNWNIEQVTGEGKLALWLESKLDLSRSGRLELLLAVPERGVVYAIPVVIQSVLGEEAIRFFRYLVCFFGFCPLVLVLPHWWKWKNELGIGLVLGRGTEWVGTLLVRVGRRFANPSSHSRDSGEAL